MRAEAPSAKSVDDSPRAKSSSIPALVEDPVPTDASEYSRRKCWTCSAPPGDQLGPDDQPFYCVCDTQEQWGLNDELLADVEVNQYCNGQGLPSGVSAGCVHNSADSACNTYDNIACTCDASYRWKRTKVGR